MIKAEPVDTRFIIITVICLVGGIITNFLLPETIKHAGPADQDKQHKSLPSSFQDPSVSDKPKLAIMLGYRDRFDELKRFAPHMASFLTRQQVPFHIFVFNQTDHYRFNKASLLNAGFVQIQDQYDYIAIHDVDTLPLNDNLKYEYPPEEGPLHISGPKTHPRYHYPTFFGGIVLLRVEHFQKINGMSNRFWGWGQEDDELYARIVDAGLKIHYPTNITTGPKNTFLDIHDDLHRRRDAARCFNQLEVTSRRDHETGLSDVRYSIESQSELAIDGVPVTVFNIGLECDKSKTPWCDCTK